MAAARWETAGCTPLGSPYSHRSSTSHASFPSPHHDARNLPPLSQKRITNWEDAEDAVMLADESIPGCIKLNVGGCFVDTDGATAAEVVTTSLAADKAAAERLAALLAATTAEMDALKKKLYSRFGSSISLEDG